MLIYIHSKSMHILWDCDNNHCQLTNNKHTTTALDSKVGKQYGIRSHILRVRAFPFSYAYEMFVILLTNVEIYTFNGGLHFISHSSKDTIAKLNN